MNILGVFFSNKIHFQNLVSQIILLVYILSVFDSSTKSNASANIMAVKQLLRSKIRGGVALEQFFWGVGPKDPKILALANCFGVRFPATHEAT